MFVCIFNIFALSFSLCLNVYEYVFVCVNEFVWQFIIYLVVMGKSLEIILDATKY